MLKQFQSTLLFIFVFGAGLASLFFEVGFLSNYLRGPAVFTSDQVKSSNSTASVFHGVEDLLREARLMSAKAVTERQEIKRVDFFCRALSAIGASFQLRPQDPANLVSWASLRQLLGNHDCEMPFASGDFAGALELALSHSRGLPAVAYNAAMVYHWSGRTQQRNQLLKRFLSDSVSLQAGQEAFILNAITSPQDLVQILPARFPQVAVFSDLIFRKRSWLSVDFLTALSGLQLQALNEAAAEWKGSELAQRSDILLDQLEALYPNLASDQVRIASDPLLAEVLSDLKQVQVARYVNFRKEQQRIPALVAILKPDERPLRSSLADWNEPEAVSLDYFFTSVGAFMPEGRLPKPIELEAWDGAARDISSSVQLMVSKDNAHWEVLGAGFKIEQFQLLRRAILGIELDQALTDFRYWKIHFASAGRQSGFKNLATKMLKIYGR